jgi:hypothetical protein
MSGVASTPDPLDNRRFPIKAPSGDTFGTAC